MQGSGFNQQVLERNLDALALLLGVDSPRQKRDWLRERIDGNIGQQFLDERFAPGADWRRVGAVDSVDQLDQSNSGKRRLLLPITAKTRFNNCATVSPFRSAAISALESRISPIAKRPAVPGGCG